MPISQTQKTYSPKASEITHAWRLIDADGQTLGRLASAVATFLRGRLIYDGKAVLAGPGEGVFVRPAVIEKAA